MSGSPDSAKCPECGSDDWSTPRPDSRVAERVNLCASLIPLACLLLTHCLLLVARLELGRWPNRFGGDDPWNTPWVRVLALPVQLSYFPVFMVPFVNFTIVASLTGLALFRGASWGPPLRTFMVGICISFPSLLLLMWDPCDVRVWLAD